VWLTAIRRVDTGKRMQVHEEFWWYTSYAMQVHTFSCVEPSKKMQLHEELVWDTFFVRILHFSLRSRWLSDP
jgi:hypothetical protein